MSPSSGDPGQLSGHTPRRILSPRRRITLPVSTYPAEPWRLVEKRFSPRYLAQTESLFATSNGYLGIRGTFEEGNPVVQAGTFLNGFYETWPIVHGEEAFGFAKTGQTMLNVTESRIIKLYVDDEPFVMYKANLLEYERALDMREGTLDRRVLWETPSGKKVSIVSRRMVSFEHRHLAVISYEVTVHDADAPVILVSQVGAGESGREASEDEDDPRLRPRSEHPCGHSVRGLNVGAVCELVDLPLVEVLIFLDPQCVNHFGRYRGKPSPVQLDH